MLHIASQQNILILGLLIVVLIGVFIYHLYLRKVRSKTLMLAQKLSEKKYLNLADMLPQMVFEVSMDGTFTFINGSGQEVTGYTRIDIEQGLNINDIIVPEQREEFIEEFLYNLEGGVNKGQEFHILNKNGLVMPMIFYMSPIMNDEKVEGIRGIIIDVSDLKHLEQQLLTAIIDTEDRERKRFAEDLHDGLGPLLSTIKLYVNQMNSSEMTEQERWDMMKYTNELLDESISSTRNIANNILPGTISDNGLVPALNSFINRISSLGHIQIEFDHDLPGRVRPSIENSIYRIVNELINNTIKHADAKRVTVQLKLVEHQLELLYKDDGKGFNEKDISYGLGLENIQSRARSIHAKAYITTAKGQGFKYRLIVNIE